MPNAANTVKARSLFLFLLGVPMCLAPLCVLSDSQALANDRATTTPNVAEPAKVSNPSRYGLLTSSRWAYGASFRKRDLTPVPNTNLHPEPQPHRDHPTTWRSHPMGRSCT